MAVVAAVEVPGCGPESFQFLYEVSGAAEPGHAEYLAPVDEDAWPRLQVAVT